MKSVFLKLFDTNFSRQLSLKNIILFSSIYLFVSIGCLWQIISVCQLFFKYSTLVSVEEEVKLCHNELPALSFCAFLEESVELTHKSNKSIGEYFKLFNLSHQLFEFKLIGPDYEPVNDTTAAEDVRKNLVQTINAVYVCFTFNSLVRPKVKAIQLKSDQIFEIRIDLSLLNKNISFLYVHNYYSLPNGWDWNTIWIKPGLNIALSFSKKTFNLLKSPYDTDCIEYPKTTSFVSQNHCMDSCRINRSLERCDVIASEANVKINQLGNFARNKKDKDCVKRLNLTEYCWDKCSHPDCSYDFFRPIVFYKEPNIFINESERQISYIRFKIPSEPQTIYNHKPKVETIEFLCYGASLIGLWFGFSFASIYYPIKRVIDWFDSSKFKNKFPLNKRRAHSIVVSQKLFDNISFVSPTTYSAPPLFGRIKSV